MTSFERVGENTYGNQHAPVYNALSYTWGRWQCSQGPALKIQGISWAVPPVSSDGFSVAEFQDVIERACHGVSFIWLDVACIDQENRAAKMLEIGRQAAIFNGANNTYVWLRSLDAAILQETTDELSTAASILEEGLINCFSDAGEELFSDVSNIYPFATPEPACLYDEVWISTIKKALQKLKQDPWFTSLWTLQEMYLAPTAVLLSRDAHPAYRREDGHETGLVKLIIWANTIFDAISRLSQGDRSIQKLNWVELDCILHLVEELGLVGSNFNNPCVLYSATRFRNAVDPLDRVYGIMQVFELHLGESAKPECTFTLEQLEIEFGAALNRRSPVWAQLFTRSRAAQPGKCWLVDQYSSIPERLCYAETLPTSSCTIHVDAAERAQFKGKACLFQSMMELWRMTSVPLIGRDGSEPASIAPDILLDVTNLDLGAIAWSVRNLAASNYTVKHRLGEELVQLFGPDLFILLIGVIAEAADDDTDEFLGMIVVRMSNREQVTWQRIGICLWQSEMENKASLQGGLWNSFEGVLD